MDNQQNRKEPQIFRAKIAIKDSQAKIINRFECGYYSHYYALDEIIAYHDEAAAQYPSMASSTAVITSEGLGVVSIIERRVIKNIGS